MLSTCCCFELFVVLSFVPVPFPSGISLRSVWRFFAKRSMAGSVSDGEDNSAVYGASSGSSSC